MQSTLEDIGWAALSSHATLQASYDLARLAIERGIPGDFVECGVFAGAQVAAMAKAIPSVNIGRRIHLFDSFQGIPQAGEHDLEYLEAGHKAGLSTCSLDQVRDYMTSWKVPPELLIYHPGWFNDTVPAANIEKIALLRLDGDLYESTKVCMEHLYPRLSPGGWLIVDDYHLAGCRKAVDEVVKLGPAYFLKQ